MAEAIDTAYITIKPDTRSFGVETRRQVAQQLRTPIPGPSVRPSRVRERDLLPSAGIRGKLLPGLVSIGTTLTGVTAGIAAFAIGAKVAFSEVAEGQAVLAQTNAVLKSTKNVAGVSAQGVSDYAQELSKLSGIDDEVVQTGENVILTFKNIRNVGTGTNAIFDRTTKAAVDLAKFGGGAFGDMNSASKQLGKALNDPIRGMGALSRSGITFNASQKETIKRLVESGHTLEAQKIILAEVESQVGGAAEAYGQTLPGGLDRLKNSISNLLGSGLEAVAPDLAEAATSAASFFEGLESGGRISQELSPIFKAVKSAVLPLFGAIKSEGPRITRIFRDLHDMVRQAMPVLKVLGVIIGVTLVVAFKVVIRQIELMVKVWKLMQGIIVKAVKIVIGAIDGLLGGLQAMADAATHIPFIGGKFEGVADGIGTAREELRGFVDELNAANGKQVNVDINVRTKTTGASLGISEHATAPDATGGATGGPTGGTEMPGPRARIETRLVNQLQLDQAKNDVAAQKEDLRKLIAFYTESVRLAKARGVGTRKYEIQLQEARNELNDIYQQAADDAKQAAEDAKNAARDRAAAADEERRATLEANIRIAALTKRSIRDDRIAYAALIAYLKERVALARKAGVGVRSAVAELKQARADIAQIIRDAAQARIDEQETLLQGRVTLAEFTPQKSDDERALRNLIAFYKKQSRNMKLSRVERQKYLIELRRTQQDLKDLKKETGTTAKEGATFGQLAVDFLKNLHGFTSNLASNIMPRGTFTNLTEATVAAKVQATTAVSAAVDTAELVRQERAGRLPQEHGRGQDLAPRGLTAAQEAIADREKAQGQPTAAQFERLLSQNAAILRVLRRIAQDQDHPEAKFNRKQSPASVVVGVS